MDYKPSKKSAEIEARFQERVEEYRQERREHIRRYGVSKGLGMQGLITNLPRVQGK